MPQSARFDLNGATLRAEPLSDSAGPIRFIWLHGWGQTRESLRPLATSLLNLGEHWLIDLPGHGEAPTPPRAYAPADYAQLVLAWLATQPAYPTILIGHSFGFRVGVHMAQQNPTAVGALVSLAGAGVPRELSAAEKSRRRFIRTSLHFARAFRGILGEGVENRLRQKFGSTDYLNASADIRPTFIAVVRDDVTDICPTLTQPVLLVYGEADTETPPSVAHKFNRLIPGSTLHLLPHHTHYTLLAGGRHVVAPLITGFVTALANR